MQSVHLQSTIDYHKRHGNQSHSMFARHLSFDHDRELTGMDRLRINAKKQRDLDARPLGEKEYEYALKPHYKQFRIPDRDMEPPFMERDAIEWQRQKEHSPDVPFAAVVPRNQSLQTLRNLT